MYIFSKLDLRTVYMYVVRAELGIINSIVLLRDLNVVYVILLINVFKHNTGFHYSSVN